MQKLIYFLLVFNTCFLYGQDNSRNDKYWSFGFNAGMIGWSPAHIQATSSTYLQRTGNYGIGTLSDNNGSQHVSIIANTSIGAHAGYMWKDKHSVNFTSVLVEFQKNKACYSFREPFHYTYKGDTVQNWVDADNYLKYSVALMRTWTFDKHPLSAEKYWYAKISFGQTFLHSNFGTKEYTGYAEDWTDKGTGKKLVVTSAAAINWMISTEIGRKFLVGNNGMFDLGIVYHAPFASTRTVEYEFFKQNISLGKSTITYPGSTIMLNVAYTYNYKIKPKPIESTKEIKIEDLAADSAEIKHHEKKFHHHKINGRRFHVQESLTVLNNEVTIQVWDKNRVDGDEISLYLNGEPILENYTVSKTKKTITVKLQPGSNIIVMHALNLGRVPPNTAALNINDGIKKTNITLVSDLHKSGAVEIIYNP